VTETAVLPRAFPHRRGTARGGRRWTAAALLAAGLAALPVLSVLWVALTPTENIWPHLVNTVLPGYIRTTLLLLAGVAAGTLTAGVATAWLVTMCRFPGRGLFEWALLLPMAMPAYIIAYTYTDLLEFAGPVQTGLRALFGWQTGRDYWFPEIRSTGGAMLMLALVLYPYVYLMARAAFLQQSVCVLEAGRTLGGSPWRCFRRVALPLARPALVAGVSLVMMETLNDFGTVDFFAVRTLTAGVFDVWLSMGNAGGGAQIALVMLLFVVLLLWAERSSRGKRRYHATSRRYQALPGYRLRGWRLAAALALCGAPVLFGFLLPALMLLFHSLDGWRLALENNFLAHARNSLLLAGTAAVATMAAGTFLAYALRLRPGRLLATAVRLASVGYALPGVVLAIGVLVPLAGFDNVLDAFLKANLGISSGLLLSGTVFALLFAYMIRFLVVGIGSAESALGKVTPGMDDAARALGAGPLRILRQVHVPMIRSGILTGGVLVFVDCMKELPATLILRPFNFDTLATHVYQYASDERLALAAPGALAIVITGVIPVILLSRSIRAARPGHAQGK